uniref:Uncharacterized protein n=1 Tax=Apteryx owenii TaxID=8824 RepID=A0A8B9NY10_APTOW
MGTLELAEFPMEKGSLELLKQKWESGEVLRPGPRGQYGLAGNRRCRRSPAPEGRSGRAAPRSPQPEEAGPAAADGQEGRAGGSAPDKSSRGSTVEKAPADGGRVEVFKEEPLGGPRRIERFPIALEDLRSRFEMRSVYIQVKCFLLQFTDELRI